MSDNEEETKMQDEEEVETPMSDDEPAGEEDDDEEEQKSTPKGKGKGKAESTKKGAAASKASSTKGNKKASPAKRKDAPTGSETGTATKKTKTGGGGAAASAVLAGTPKDVLRTYMRQQNRPYTALVIYENLHHAIKKPTLIQLCDELCADGDLQMKDFKKVRVYMAKQHDADVATPAEMDALAAKEASVKESVNEAKAANSKLDSQIRAIQNEPSDAELAKQLAEYQKKIETLNAKLARFKNDKNPVTKDGMNKAQAKFNDTLKAWKLRRAAANDMLNAMAGDEGDPKELRERLGIETDEDAGDNIAQWKDLEKAVKK